MRTEAASAASAVGARRHNENDVTITIAGLWRYGDWRHVATGCTALVALNTRPATSRRLPELEMASNATTLQNRQDGYISYIGI